MRSGSSLKDTSGSSGVRSTAGGEVGHAAEGVDQLGRLALGAGDPQGHGVDREVAAGQVGLDLGRRTTTSGLRESGT